MFVSVMVTVMVMIMKVMVLLVVMVLLDDHSGGNHDDGDRRIVVW